MFATVATARLLFALGTGFIVRMLDAQLLSTSRSPLLTNCDELLHWLGILLINTCSDFDQCGCVQLWFSLARNKGTRSKKRFASFC